ncbi:hypothetical protein BLOT_012394 [Blomia tropicalis]|nr:hypothetical protein BLOT_012394 [Blomia tropicalis]
MTPYAKPGSTLQLFHRYIIYESKRKKFPRMFLVTYQNKKKCSNYMTIDFAHYGLCVILILWAIFTKDKLIAIKLCEKH